MNYNLAHFDSHNETIGTKIDIMVGGIYYNFWFEWYFH